MQPITSTENPFAVLTLIAAPALLTNASSILALSTINRMLRTRDRMQELMVKSEKGRLSESEAARLVAQVNRVERQAIVLLRALRAIYVALGAFVGATLATLIGAGLAPSQGTVWFVGFAVLGLLSGCVGVGGLMLGSAGLVQATQLSLLNLRDEADLIRNQQSPARSGVPPSTPPASP